MNKTNLRSLTHPNGKPSQLTRSKLGLFKDIINSTSPSVLYSDPFNQLYVLWFYGHR